MENAYDIYRQNYVVEPGYFYTFRIVANQIVTTERFDNLHQNMRGCKLPHENGNENLFKFYSKNGCELQCTLRFIITQNFFKTYLIRCFVKFLKGPEF